MVRVMHISVRVKPNSKREGVEKTGENEYTARVHQPPNEGKANDAMIELLSEYFDVAKTRIRIVSGKSSRNKLIEIE